MVIEHLINHPWRLSISLFKFGCAVHLTQSQLFQLAPCQGPSMLPTFSVEGDWIASDMTHARNRRGALRVGDLVLYSIPVDAASVGVKRIIGMPGDYVVGGTVGEPGGELMIQVPEGHCWVVGDNLTASRDSRFFGPLPLALIKGKVIAQVLPWSEKHWIDNGLEPTAEP